MWYTVLHQVRTPRQPGGELLRSRSRSRSRLLLLLRLRLRLPNLLHSLSALLLCLPLLALRAPARAHEPRRPPARGRARGRRRAARARARRLPAPGDVGDQRARLLQERRAPLGRHEHRQARAARDRAQHHWQPRCGGLGIRRRQRRRPRRGGGNGPPHCGERQRRRQWRARARAGAIARAWRRRRLCARVCVCRVQERWRPFKTTACPGGCRVSHRGGRALSPHDVTTKDGVVPTRRHAATSSRTAASRTREPANPRRASRCSTT